MYFSTNIPLISFFDVCSLLKKHYNDKKKPNIQTNRQKKKKRNRNIQPGEKHKKKS